LPNGNYSASRSALNVLPLLKLHDFVKMKNKKIAFKRQIKPMPQSGAGEEGIHIIRKTAVEPRHTISDYARNVVALGEMEHQTAGLSEPARVSFRLSHNKP